MPLDPYAWIDKSLDTLHRADWYRSVKSLEGMAGPVVRLDGQEVINFASNDYLGLASDPRLAAAAIEAIQTYGTGSTGSRLLSGHRPLHEKLESAIAALKQTEDALVFSSGYLANIGTISALVGPRDLVLSDQYNHSSLKNGARMSGATLVDYAHCSLSALAQQLQDQRHRYRRCLILTDSVFSMDGDLCPLPKILDLAEQFDSMVLVDEAHATGVLGSRGAGCVEHFGCSGRPLVQVGTLSKALGSLGGYVAGTASLIDFLRNRAPSWIYTTGLTPADTAAALKAIEIVQSEPEMRSHLWSHVDYLRQQLNCLWEATPNAPLPVRQLPSESPILCIEVQDAATVIQAGRQLRDLGLFVSPVRPPTSPTSRLRITLMASHVRSHLDQLVLGLKKTLLMP
ncbi:MAG: 8-amino-7-oxononanoate synthase [Cyanobacteria bacterium Co-bin13]|nr:8-amino-7-oxononanoate synthase [Cyanobacteria bacterium Co-bin13]